MKYTIRYNKCIHCNGKITNFHKKYFIEEIVDFDNRKIVEKYVCEKCFKEYDLGEK